MAATEATDATTPAEQEPLAAKDYLRPAAWVPTVYFAMGTVYITATTLPTIFYKNLGLTNAEAAAYASSLALAYVIKPLWAPLLEIYATRKFFVVLMQFVLAAALTALAFALKMPGRGFLLPSYIALNVVAFAGATMDIGSDGVYVTTLRPKVQAFFAGMQSMFWSIGPIVASGVLVTLSGTIFNKTGSYHDAWFQVTLILAAILLAIGIYHSFLLPSGEKSKDAPKSAAEALGTFGTAFGSFFTEKKDIALMIAFAYFYRFGVGLLDKIGPLFLLDARANGGLGLTNESMGAVIGTYGTIGFLLASVLGGWFVTAFGLKRWTLIFLCLCMNVPNATFLYLATARPESQAIITTVIFIEKFGYGFGAVAHMLYMMQQIAPGRFKTAHYAFATGIMGLCMMSTGSASGLIQAAVGYQSFFVIVLVCAIPSVLACVFAPFHHSVEPRTRKA